VNIFTVALVKRVALDQGLEKYKPSSLFGSCNGVLRKTQTSPANKNRVVD